MHLGFSRHLPVTSSCHLLPAVAPVSVFAAGPETRFSADFALLYFAHHRSRLCFLHPFAFVPVFIFTLAFGKTLRIQNRGWKRLSLFLGCVGASIGLAAAALYLWYILSIIAFLLYGAASGMFLVLGTLWVMTGFKEQGFKEPPNINSPS